MNEEHRPLITRNTENFFAGSGTTPRPVLEVRKFRISNFRPPPRAGQSTGLTNGCDDMVASRGHTRASIRDSTPNEDSNPNIAPPLV